MDDVFAYATALLRDRSAAEEVTAAAFERALRRAHTFVALLLAIPGAIGLLGRRTVRRRRREAALDAG